MTTPTATPRIDTHQHFWRYEPRNYSWINSDMSALQRDYDPLDHTVRELVAPLSEAERARILGGTAIEAYQL